LQGLVDSVIIPRVTPSKELPGRLGPGQRGELVGVENPEAAVVIDRLANLNVGETRLWL